MKIGLPRGLLYHSYGPFMDAFFEALPVDVEISQKTDRAVLDKGTAVCIDEACLPVKVFCGHVETLREKCDKIVVPRIMNCEYGESLCPKLNGLPELMGGGDDLIFTDRIDLKNENALFRSLYRPCRQLGMKRRDIKNAFHEGMEAWEQRSSGFCQTEFRRSVFLAGHSYNVYDSFVNMNLIEKLNRMGIGIITEEAVDRVYKEQYVADLIKKPFWHNFTALYGAARYLEDRKMIDGIICLSSFSCGTDSFTMEMIKNNTKIPVLVLKLDEMTGEAGFDTRLEAFCEVICNMPKTRDLQRRRDESAVDDRRIPQALDLCELQEQSEEASDDCAVPAALDQREPQEPWKQSGCADSQAVWREVDLS